MSNRFNMVGLACALLLTFSRLQAGTNAPDYSKEALVIQQMTTKVKFSADGAREWQQTLSVRIQSEAAVREFGVLSFSYGSANEKMNVEYVRVRKPDGSVVETPASSILDVATEIATAAPTYSDLRQKQIPVKALGVGDVLEYSVHSVQQSPEVPGQFWYDQYFLDDTVVLDQILEISVPKNKYLQVSSPKLQPEMRDDGDQRIYLWKHSHREASKPENQNKATTDVEPPKVQITTFKNWEEVGRWWASLVGTQITVTAPIRDKALELTQGLSSDSDKAKAIYRYVAMKFRYISISFGAGRYQPHNASEVLANQYGDCKDKHVLFAALLKAVGIQSWPALIGAGIKFDEAVPSPAQFNHVVTVLPEGGKYIWLDTTAEVAPFGLLSQVIRDEQALVIPTEGKPFLAKTPLNPPSGTSEQVDVKSTLAADGTLTGRFALDINNDSALVLRSAFRQLAPTQWQAFVQRVSYGMGYAGDVSGVEVEKLENIEESFHYEYDYTRKNYSDWAEHKITPPLPALSFGPGAEADKPKESFWIGAPGRLTYRASVQLPKGFSAAVPSDSSLNSGFADYSGHYVVKNGVLVAERKMTIKQAKISLDQWAEYQKFSKDLQADQSAFISLSEIASAPAGVPSADNPAADRLMEQVGAAMKKRNVKEVEDLLAQVERLNSKQPKLWAIYGVLAMRSGKLDEAVADCQKEIRLHPDETIAYQELSAVLLHTGRQVEAIEAGKKALALEPQNEYIAAQLATLLLESKRYGEVPAVLEKPIASAPNNERLQVLRAKALLHTAKQEEVIGEMKKIAEASSDPYVLNELAYALCDTVSALDIAKEWAQKAIHGTEQDTTKTSLADLGPKDLAAVNMLIAEWDTLGWLCFRQNNLAMAEEYIKAAWQWGQHDDVGDHLAQIYKRQGKRTAAIRMWRLALVTNSKNEEARQELQKAGVPVVQPLATNGKRSSTAPVAVAEEFGLIRTINIPELPTQTGSAEFFLLIARDGIEDVRLIGESDKFKEAGPAIKAARYAWAFPDAGPEKMVRRGILSCSTYTHPSCELTMLLPSSTTMEGVPAHSLEGHNAASGAAAVVPPTILTKVEPEYSKEAPEAQAEGTVRLSTVISETGIPDNVTVVQPLGMGLDEKARECVLKWRFRPAMKGGKPVRSDANIEVNFRLRKETP